MSALGIDDMHKVAVRGIAPPYQRFCGCHRPLMMTTQMRCVAAAGGGAAAGDHDHAGGAGKGRLRGPPREAAAQALQAVSKNFGTEISTCASKT